MLQVIIRDFQSIEEAKLKVDGVTLIVGESNQGKSACLRALQAACANRFKAGQVRHGQDHATIRIKTEESDDVLTVMRSWSGGSPRMVLAGKEFSKLGRTLPKEVTDFLKLGTIDLNGEQYSCNFHPQFQKPMLLEHSQQKVMEILSASTALDDLKETKECVLSARAKNKGAITAVEGIINETHTKLASIRDEIQSIEPIYEQYSTVFANYEATEDILTAANQLSVLLKDLKRVTRKLELLSKVERLCSEQQSTLSGLELLNKLTTYTETLTRLSCKEAVNKTITVVYSPELDKKVYNVNLLAELLHTKQLKSQEEERLNKKLDILQQILSKDDVIRSYNDTRMYIEQLETTLHNYKFVLSNESSLSRIVEDKECPICGNKVNIEVK